MNQLGEILKQGRDNKNLSQDEVALAVGIERKTYSTYESNRSEPKLDLLGKLARFLDIGDELYLLFMEQNVPRATVNLMLQLPGPEASLLDLVKVQKELRDALKQIENRIDLISEGGDNLSPGHSQKFS